VLIIQEIDYLYSLKLHPQICDYRFCYLQRFLENNLVPSVGVSLMGHVEFFFKLKFLHDFSSVVFIHSIFATVDNFDRCFEHAWKLVTLLQIFHGMFLMRKLSMELEEFFSQRIFAISPELKEFSKCSVAAPIQLGY